MYVADATDAADGAGPGRADACAEADAEGAPRVVVAGVGPVGRDDELDERARGDGAGLQAVGLAVGPYDAGTLAQQGDLRFGVVTDVDEELALDVLDGVAEGRAVEGAELALGHGPGEGGRGVDAVVVVRAAGQQQHEEGQKRVRQGVS